MAGLTKVSIGRLVRGVSAAIAGWNSESNEPEYVEVRDGALLVRAVTSGESPPPAPTGGRNELIFQGAVTWPSGASANTVRSIDVPTPELPSQGGMYLVSIINPSAATGLGVTVANLVTADGSQHDVTIAGFGVKASEKHGVPIGYWLLGDGGRITLTNDTALGAGVGFTALVLVQVP